MACLDRERTKREGGRISTATALARRGAPAFESIAIGVTGGKDERMQAVPLASDLIPEGLKKLPQSYPCVTGGCQASCRLNA